MGRARKKSGTLVFILLTLKWTRIKDSDKIKKRINSILSTLANAQLLNSNQSEALPQNSPLSQMLNVAEKELSNLESIT